MVLYDLCKLKKFKKEETMQKGILDYIKGNAKEADKLQDISLYQAGRTSAYQEVLALLKNAEEFDCGLYSKWDAEIKGKYSEHGKSVALPANYKVIIVEIGEHPKEE